MATHCKMMTENEVKICSNCEHFKRTSFTMGCSLNKWDLNSATERFFYDPDKRYWDIDMEQGYVQMLWENGVMCKEYVGNKFIITSMSTSVTTPVMFPTMDGNVYPVSTDNNQYEISVIEVDIMMPRQISVTLRSSEVLSNWLKNIVL